MQLFMSHIVSCLHFIERENIFSSCVSSTQFFLNLVCVFFFIPNPLYFSPKLFFPKLVLFFLFLQGEKFFLTFMVLRRSCYSSQGELSLFSLTLLRIFSVYLLIGQSLLIHDKKGETQMTCLFCLGGEYKKLFEVSNLGGELEFTFVFYILFHIIVYMSFFPHMR